MKTPLITITTDFGDQFATSQLHAVVRKLEFDGHLIENHDVSPYAIVEGAYGIWQLSKHTPPRTVHLGVIDPGVGSERAGVVIKTSKYWFVGPDNGLLWPAANKYGIEKVWRLQESEFGEVAQTFHGRDVFIKAAVYLAQGKTPEEFGCVPWEQEKLVKLEFEKGQIVHIDHYGNIKFYWDEKVKPGDKLFNVPVVHTFSDVELGQPLILNGSSELLELAINQGDAKSYFGLKLGDNLISSNLSIKKII